MSNLKKRQFVEKTFEIIEQEGLKEVKIRRIAKEMNCTSTVIYRYFDNLEHLISLASIYYLKEYIAAFSKLVSDPMILIDPYALNLRMWECLAQYAFRHMDIYEMIFFGKNSFSLGEIIFEYYQIFLEDEKSDFDGYSVSILFNDDLEERDYVLLRRASALGIISSDSARILSQLETYVFHGILLKYKEKNQEPGIVEQALAEFHDLLYSLEQKYRLK